MTGDNWLNKTTASEQTTTWVPTPSSYCKMNYRDPWVKLFCFSCERKCPQNAKNWPFTKFSVTRSEDKLLLLPFFSYRCWCQSSICDVCDFSSTSMFQATNPWDESNCHWIRSSHTSQLQENLPALKKQLKYQ